MNIKKYFENTMNSFGNLIEHATKKELFFALLLSFSIFGTKIQASEIKSILNDNNVDFNKLFLNNQLELNKLFFDIINCKNPDEVLNKILSNDNLNFDNFNTTLSSLQNIVTEDMDVKEIKKELFEIFSNSLLDMSNKSSQLIRQYKNMELLIDDINKSDSNSDLLKQNLFLTVINNNIFQEFENNNTIIKSILNTVVNKEYDIQEVKNSIEDILVSSSTLSKDSITLKNILSVLDNKDIESDLEETKVTLMLTLINELPLFQEYKKTLNNLHSELVEYDQQAAVDKVKEVFFNKYFSNNEELFNELENINKELDKLNNTGGNIEEAKKIIKYISINVLSHTKGINADISNFILKVINIYNNAYELSKKEQVKELQSIYNEYKDSFLSHKIVYYSIDDILKNIAFENELNLDNKDDKILFDKFISLFSSNSNISIDDFNIEEFKKLGLYNKDLASILIKYSSFTEDDLKKINTIEKFYSMYKGNVKLILVKNQHENANSITNSSSF